MKVVYHPRYAQTDLGDHVFRVEKYPRTLEALLSDGIIVEADLIDPDPVSWEDLAMVHSPAYLEDLRQARLSPRTMFSELPVERALIEGFVFMAGGTAAAARAALRDGVAAHLAGGFHHAMRDRAEGFCYVNDLAYTLALLLREGAVGRPAVIDCDLHQGNGTAAIFEDRPEIFTFSIHQREIYPIPKARSSLDMELPAGTEDDDYLDRLGAGLEAVYEGHAPDLVLYQAGADPFREDVLGDLRISRGGLARRDRMVLEGAARKGIPLAVTLGGGYARRVEDTVAIHAETVRIAAELAPGWVHRRGGGAGDVAKLGDRQRK